MASPRLPRGRAATKPTRSRNAKRTTKPKQTRRPRANRRKTQGSRADRGGVVVGLGLSTADLLCVAPRIDERTVELSMFSMQGGGTTGNALATLATFGARSRYFGRLGDDEFGTFTLRSLSELGVDTSSCLVERGKVSPVSVISIDELSRRRKVLFSKGSITPLTPRDLPPRLLDRATLLYIDGYQPALQAAIAEKARARGITVLLNASHLAGGMGELLALADIVIGSERFAAELAPSDEIEKSLTEILRLGPRTAVITLGDQGAIGVEGETLVQQEPVDVFVADTTGAGDVFCGAFAYAVLQGWELKRALPFANAAAGLRCRSIGARAGLPSLEEVLDLAGDADAPG
jgi:sugar/nucleoside kinase (ribokinase family)